MQKMEFQTIPENKHNENFEKACAIAEERNKEIAKLFGVEPRDPKVIFFESSGGISGRLHSLEKEFKGYVDGTEEILLLHPDAGEGFFTSLWDEMKMISDFALIKYYLCKIYFPEKNDFKMYYKHVSDGLASVVSGKYQPSIANFELKIYTPGKHIKKDKLVPMVLYLMREYSGIEFIMKNLNTIMEDKDIEKSVSKIYNKTLDDMFLPEKEKVIEAERKKQEIEKEKRRAAFNANQKNYSTNNARRPHHNPQKKFVTRDKFKAKNNNNKKENEYNKKPQLNSKPKINFNKTNSQKKEE